MHDLVHGIDETAKFFVSYYHSQQEVDYYNCQSDVSGWWVFGLEHKTN